MLGRSFAKVIWNPISWLLMMPTTDNFEMPDSETFKERFLATAKNKDDILEVLTKNKDNLINNDTLDNP